MTRQNFERNRNWVSLKITIDYILSKWLDGFRIRQAKAVYYIYRNMLYDTSKGVNLIMINRSREIHYSFISDRHPILHVFI